MRHLITKIGLILTIACSAQAITIIQKPIHFSPQRIELTRAYMHDSYGLAPTVYIQPTMIVVHYTLTATAKHAFNYLNKTYISKDRGSVAAKSRLNVSAHFLVDRDGTIYQLMPTNWMARHVIGLDYMAIGIENVGGTKAYPLTKAQLQANIALIFWLNKKYPDIRYLIGHYEYGQYRNTPLWKEHDHEYFTFKQDPGAAFMRDIRAAVKSLKLEPTNTLPDNGTAPTKTLR